MVSPQGDAVQRYEALLAIGAQILTLLQVSPGHLDLDQIERLLEGRAAAVAELGPPHSASAPSTEIARLGAELVEQQALLERQLTEGLIAVRRSLSEAQGARHNMVQTGRMLRGEGLSRLLDQRR